MLSFKKTFLAAAAVLTMAAAPAMAATVWDEAVDGDLGPLTSTETLSLSAGSNIITGEVGGGDQRDAFILDLAGLTLVSIDVVAIEIDSGSTVRFTNCLVSTNGACGFSADENAGTSFQVSDLGGDLLADLLGSNPISAITNFFEMTESEGPSRYTLDFVTVSSVPVPASLPLLAMGLGAMGFAGKRRRKSA